MPKDPRRYLPQRRHHFAERNRRRPLDADTNPEAEAQETPTPNAERPPLDLSAPKYNDACETYGLNPASLYAIKELCYHLHFPPYSFKKYILPACRTFKIGTRCYIQGYDIIQFLNNAKQPQE